MIDFSTFKLNRKPNQFLIAPTGLCGQATPHAESPQFDCSREELMNRLRQLALAEPRVVEVTPGTGSSDRAIFVARSKVFRFPDVIDVQVIDVGDGRSTLAIYSRAKIGIRDFGVNRQRIEGWLSRLAM